MIQQRLELRPPHPHQMLGRRELGLFELPQDRKQRPPLPAAAPPAKEPPGKRNEEWVDSWVPAHSTPLETRDMA